MRAAQDLALATCVPQIGVTRNENFDNLDGHTRPAE